MLFGILAIMQSRLHLLFAWQFLLQKMIAHSFFSNSDAQAMVMALTFEKVDGGLFHGVCNLVQ